VQPETHFASGKRSDKWKKVQTRALLGSSIRLKMHAFAAGDLMHCVANAGPFICAKFVAISPATEKNFKPRRISRFVKVLDDNENIE